MPDTLPEADIPPDVRCLPPIEEDDGLGSIPP